VQFYIFVVQQKRAFRKVTKEKNLKTIPPAVIAQGMEERILTFFTLNMSTMLLLAALSIRSEISKTQITMAKAIVKTNLQENEGAVTNAGRA
jgi:hypothetical protein